PVYRRDEREPLDADVVIVDEASMIDVRLMAALLRAMKRGSRLILIGDADQLPSVGAGRVLCDLIESKRFCTVCLTDIFRQSAESLIVTNAHRINRGEMPILDAKDKDFFYLPVHEDNIPSFLADLITRRLPKAYGKGIIEDIQVVTPSRKGRAGTERLNEILREAENPSAYGKKEKKIHGTLFREGDRVMQVRNNYDLTWKKDNVEGNGVFNGDVGLLQKLADEEGGEVLFDGRVVPYDKDALEELDHAYAITIHKSQGSEYPVVIMPLYDCPPMLLTRNLLYTAVTRACRMVILVGRKDVIGRMVGNDRHVMRYTLLLAHLSKN
ncbi:MAG: AAA family ATPase, partial [Clostridia bacterium]|nr:AAA family ATPase [Clostridia bacterium]